MVKLVSMVKWRPVHQLIGCSQLTQSLNYLLPVVKLESITEQISVGEFISIIDYMSVIKLIYIVGLILFRMNNSGGSDTNSLTYNQWVRPVM